jgi:DNA-binding NarL/FixJ family response regulator
MERIRVLISSHQSLLRRGIEQALSQVEDMEISGAAEINDELLSTMDNLPPDVVVVDIDTPAGDGFAITRQIKQRLPNIGIIALAANCDDAKILEAIKAQASDCLSKEISAEQLVESIRRVARGEHPINESLVTHPIIADQVLRQFQVLSQHNETKNLVSPLTPRETEILGYVAQGMLNKQIATQLGISEQTIKNHVTSILRKLNANARTEAVILAIKQGLISIHQTPGS